MAEIGYTRPDAAYLAKRSLRRHGGVLQLWALGVGAVISGGFFGWNFGLLSGGFGGLIVALGIITLLFIGLCFSIAEMSPALPHAGGAGSFARTAMGPWGGYITGQIGRASCRGRVEISGVAVSLKKKRLRSK